MANPLLFQAPQQPIADTKTGLITRPWYMWLMQLLNDATGFGDVFGPSNALDGQIVLFSGTSGKLLKGATGTGFVVATNGVYGVTADPSSLGYWSELTNGDPDVPELIFDSFGNTIDLFVPTP